MYRPILLALALVAWPASHAVSAQTVREVRLEHEAKLNEFRFAPAEITAHAGDVLVFRVTGGGDHSIVFEPGISAPARALLNAAMPRRVGELSGPMMGPRAEYRFTIPALPAGRYRFFCLPHRAYDEVGVLIIQ